MNIKTLFIDIGQVVVALDYPAALRKVSQHSKVPPFEIERRLKLHADIAEYESGRISTDAFYLGTKALLELEVDRAGFELAWQEIFVLDPGPDACISADLFAALKRDYQVVALSNTNEMHFEYLQAACPLIREFDDYVLSFEVGAMKPEPRIYEAALKVTGRRPEETFFVDDLAVNIAGAAALGIRGVVFEGERALRRDLSRLGLLAAPADQLTG